MVEAQLALSLSRLAATHGEPLAALDYVTLTIRSHYDSGSIFFIIQPLAVLAALLDRLGRHESAATISGFAANPLTRAAYPEVNTAITHLREVLGGQAYESLAHAGENMTTSAMATYAFDQIDQARTHLLRQ